MTLGQPMHSLPKAADIGDLEAVIAQQDSGSATQAEQDLALARACCQGHFRIADLLVNGGADPNGQYETAPGVFDYGPILLASCEFLNPQGVEYLLKHGANPNGNAVGSGCFQVKTPLEMVRDSYQTSEDDRKRCTELLINAGARMPRDDSDASSL